MGRDQGVAVLTVTPSFFFVPSLVDRLLTVSVIVQKVLPVEDSLFTDPLLSL